MVNQRIKGTFIENNNCSDDVVQTQLPLERHDVMVNSEGRFVYGEFYFVMSSVNDSKVDSNVQLE